MSKAGCKNIVFSSSATVYGKPQYLPYDEAHPTNSVNPYGRTMLMIENIISDWTKVDTERNIKKICEDTWRWHKLNPIGYRRE